MSLTSRVKDKMGGRYHTVGQCQKDKTVSLPGSLTATNNHWALGHLYQGVTERPSNLGWLKKVAGLTPWGRSAGTAFDLKLKGVQIIKTAKNAKKFPVMQKKFLTNILNWATPFLFRPFCPFWAHHCNLRLLNNK